MSDIIHRAKLFGGRETAMQVHRRLAWNDAKCLHCGAPAAVQVTTFCALSDMSSETRMAIEFEIAMGKIKTIMLKSGESVKLSRVHACSTCKPALLRQAAKGPSWLMVDIDSGPGEDKPVVSVLRLVE